MGGTRQIHDSNEHHNQDKNASSKSQQHKRKMATSDLWPLTCKETLLATSIVVFVVLAIAIGSGWSPVSRAPSHGSDYDADHDTRNFHGGKPKDISLPPIGNIAIEFKYEDKQLETIYEMNTNPRGYCVIINMRKKRQGTDQDAKSLKQLFENLKFKVKEYPGLSKHELEQLARQVKRTYHGNMSSFVMFILAHGKRRTGEDFIVADDDKFTAISEIEKSIKGGIGLAGKPKLLFIESCRGDHEDRGVEYNAEEFDGIDNDQESDLWITIPRDADFLTAHATVKGHSALRNPQKGTRFIQKLVQVFERDAHKSDVLSMLTEVKRAVGSDNKFFKQAPETTDTLRKKLFFGRPPHNDRQASQVPDKDSKATDESIDDDKSEGKADYQQESRNSGIMDKELTIKDLGSIMKDIKGVEIHYQKLGQSFHINANKIGMIKYQYDRDPWQALNDIVSEWLRWNFDRNTEDGKYPTRRWLVKAVGEVDDQLAEELEKKYASS